MTRLDGGQLLVRGLRQAGVDTVFALHGAHLDPFFVACVQNGVRLVDGRHEGAVGHSADGFARSTGRLGVAAVTAGAGFSNCVPSLASAYLDRVPLLLITSSPPLLETELNELQGGIDQVAMARPITKWAHRVLTTERIPDLLALAVRKALSGPPGPVLLDVPIDVMFREVEIESLPLPGIPRLGSRPAPSPAAVSETLEQLKAAERPVIIVGNGMRWVEAQDLLREFAERSGIPVFTQVTTCTGLPADHRLNGLTAWNLAALQEVPDGAPDLVMLLGARPGRYLGGRTGSMIPDSATVIQVEIDDAEIGRVRPADVAVAADVRETLAALLDADSHAWPDWTEWSKRAVSARATESRFSNDPTEVEGRMHPFHAVREVLLEVDPGSTLVIEGGETAGWVMESLHLCKPGDVLGLGGYLGILGLATGLAIGAQVARPDNRVVLISGDGAAGFHIQEYDTMVRHELPIITVVVNNALWAQSARNQAQTYGQEGEIISHLRDTDYERVAMAFGAYGERVNRVADVRGAVRRALDSGRPACINLTVAYGPEPRTASSAGHAPTGNEDALPYYGAKGAAGSERR